MSAFTTEVIYYESHLETQDTEKVGSPGQLEPDRRNVLPRRAVLGHAPSGDTYQSFNAISHVGCTGQWSRVGQLPIKQSIIS